MMWLGLGVWTLGTATMFFSALPPRIGWTATVLAYVGTWVVAIGARRGFEIYGGLRDRRVVREIERNHR